MGKRVATVGLIQEESSPVKKYATFDFTVEKKEDDVTTSEDFSSDEEELKEQPEVVSKSVSIGATDRSSGSSDSDSEEEELKEQPEVVSVGATNRSSGSSDSDSEEEEKEMEVVITPKVPETASRNGSGDVLEKELVSSDSSGSEHSCSDEDNEIVDLKKDQGDDISDESDEEEQQRKKLKVTVDNDEEMVDAELPKTNSKVAIESKAPETPTTTQIQKTGSKKLFVGNLSFSLEQEDLEEFFKDAGQIVDVQFATHGDGRFKGHAIIEFATEESVQKALERNGENLMGKSVKLSLPGKSGGVGSGWRSDVDAKSPKTNSKPKTPTTPEVQKTGSKKLFVGNLSFSLEQKDLEKFFKDAGEIVKVDLATLKDGRSKGHAIVTFAAEEAVQKALEKNGQDLMGRQVHIGGHTTPQTGHARGGRSGSRGGRRRS
ncbi:nucleolin 1-like isoform X1 [Papaver somniferum]|uniref:nucleolin 1-like isoform X1 n=1 Tax=Papaver somniferum TaxID=3469 RepID=UPI000E704D8B|nr:nucleolin 1-like isoform X1 [Papaver somniferum]